MEWTESNEDILKQIALEAEIYYLCHIEEYRNYKHKSLYFIIPTIAISGIIGGISFSDYTTDNNNIKISIASLNIFLAILNSLYKIFNIDEIITNNFYLSKMWFLLYEKIRLELNKSPNDRHECKEFINDIIDMKIQLLEKNIILSTEIIKKYKNKYKNKNFDLPLALNHLSPIQIYQRPETQPLTPSMNSSLITEYTI